jgi:hypothetical protein
VHISPTRVAFAALTIAACSGSHGSAGTPGNYSDGGSSSGGGDDGGISGGDGGVGADVGVVDARTIQPVQPGVWRDITPPSLDATLATSTACTDIQFDPSNRTTIYAYYGGVGIYKSTDAGSTWAPIGNLPQPASLGRLLIDPHDSTHIYTTGSVTGSSLGFWESHDGGNTFTTPPAFAAGVGTTWNQDVYNVVADPTDFKHLLLTFHQAWPCCGGADAAGVLETKDGGKSFVAHNPPTGMDHGQGIAFLYNPVLNLGNASTWLVGAGYNAGLFVTKDAGATWAQVSTLQEDHGGFDAHYSKQGFVYIGASDGVYRSTDNGQTWQHESQGAQANWTYSVISDGKNLYSSPAFVGQPFNQPFFVSPEGGPNEGTTWTAFSAQTIPNGPWKMVIDSANGIIYSANWSSGAWALTLND